MQIRKHVTSGELTVKIEGRIDTTTTSMLEGERKLLHVNEEIMEMLDMTGPADLLRIE